MTTFTPPATIAFIGLGMMGRPMAKRLVEAGFTLRVFDVSQKAVSDFVGAHPSALATPSAKDKLALMGLVPSPSGSAELLVVQRRESDMWAPLVQASGFTPGD